MTLRTEKFRLTVLQRQIIFWLRNEGGGCLRADHLFTTMVKNHQAPDAEPAVLAERMYEAVENLCKMEYVEIRVESLSRLREPISLYDLGSAGKNFINENDIYTWAGKDCPSVALTNAGLQYAGGN